MIGLGLALAQPKRKVLVITGDGEMLMNVGSLASIAVEAPKNLTIAVLDNERFGETGMQKTPTAFGVDLAAIATACGIRTSRIVRTMAEVTELRDLAHEGRGTAFAQIKINPEALAVRDAAGGWRHPDDRASGNRCWETRRCLIERLPERFPAKWRPVRVRKRVK